MYIGILDYQPIIDTILEKAVDMETGEITDEELLEQVNALEMERLDKVENIALEYKNNCYMVDAIDQEIAKLQLRKKEMQEKNEKINKLLGLLLDYEKFETAKVKLSFRKSILNSKGQWAATVRYRLCKQKILLFMLIK